MNEILNQKFGVEVEMYNITRAKAAQVVQQTLTALTGETWNVTLPGAHLDERKIFPMSDGRLSDRCWKSNLTLPSRLGTPTNARNWSARC